MITNYYQAALEEARGAALAHLKAHSQRFLAAAARTRDQRSSLHWQLEAGRVELARQQIEKVFTDLAQDAPDFQQLNRQLDLIEETVTMSVKQGA